MKTKDFMNELNSKSVDDLQKDLVAAKSRIKDVRKNIARIQTVIAQKANA